MGSSVRIDPRPTTMTTCLTSQEPGSEGTEVRTFLQQCVPILTGRFVELAMEIEKEDAGPV